MYNAGTSELNAGSMKRSAAPRFFEREHFAPSDDTYELLPFRFARIPRLPNQVLLTSIVGEYLFVSEREFDAIRSGSLKRDTELYRSLRSRQLVCDSRRGPLMQGLAAQQRTRKLLAEQDPALHIFVVTLRCDHRCTYCQVSPRHVYERGFDMSKATADAALDHVFSSKAPCLTIEFQGGESALAFERVRYVIERAVPRAKARSQRVRFVMATTLHLLSDEMLHFCRDYDVELSTSLDGPEYVHDASRINVGRDSYGKTIHGIERARRICGHERVAALATITRHSLPYAREIIDTYVALEFGSIALRPLSPFGFAAKSVRKLGYSTQEYLAFYRDALQHLIQLNLAGTAIEEAYATLLLTKILTPFPTAYVDLQSPAAAGSGVLVYNYDGSVYVSDEGRMLAAMGNDCFRMGSVQDGANALQRSRAMDIVRSAAVAEQLPTCSDCAFVPYCGADPVYHVATQNDPVGDKSKSDFCHRHMGLFRILFEELARKDSDTMRVFLSWIARRPIADVPRAGYVA